MTQDVQPPDANERSADEICEWIRFHLSTLLKCSRDEIDVNAHVSQLGVDSAAAVGMTMDLEDWLGRRIEPAVVFDYATIAELARGLAAGAGASGSQNPPSA